MMTNIFHCTPPERETSGQKTPKNRENHKHNGVISLSPPLNCQGACVFVSNGPPRIVWPCHPSARTEIAEIRLAIQMRWTGGQNHDEAAVRPTCSIVSWFCACLLWFYQCFFFPFHFFCVPPFFHFSITFSIFTFLHFFSRIFFALVRFTTDGGVAAAPCSWQLRRWTRRRPTHPPNNRPN